MNLAPILDPFRKPSAELMAQRELEEARRALLEAQSAMEYAAAMVEYHSSRIQRLTYVVKGTSA